MLNKNRIVLSKLLAVIVIIIAAITHKEMTILDSSYSIDIACLIGFFLVVFGALGRLYCTVFLGGHKSKKIIDYGPFSIVRNPLYIFSFICVIGLGLISNNILVLLVTPITYIIIYYPLIKREEGFLTEKFGDTYKKYCLRTKRLTPSFKNYKKEEFITCSSNSLMSAFRDVIWWFIGIVLFYGLNII